MAGSTVGDLGALRRPARRRDDDARGRRRPRRRGDPVSLAGVRRGRDGLRRLRRLRQLGRARDDRALGSRPAEVHGHAPGRSPRRDRESGSWRRSRSPWCAASARSSRFEQAAPRARAAARRARGRRPGGDHQPARRRMPPTCLFSGQSSVPTLVSRELGLDRPLALRDQGASATRSAWAADSAAGRCSRRSSSASHSRRSPSSRSASRRRLPSPSAPPRGMAAMTRLLITPVLFAALLVGRPGLDVAPAAVLAASSAWVRDAGSRPA